MYSNKKLEESFNLSLLLMHPCRFVLLITAMLAALPACAQVPLADSAMAAGVQALRAGDASTAVENFHAAIKLRPQFAEAYLNLGLALQQTGNVNEAREALERAATLKPALRGPHLFLGILEYQQNQLGKAEAALRRETELNPQDAKAWMWLGVDQLAQAHPEQAAASLDTAVRLAPGDVDILYHRGRAHLLVSQDSYQQMFKLDPDSYRVHQVLGQGDAEADRRPEAVAEYRLAIDRAPHGLGLHEALGDLYWTDGKMELADPEYQQELAVDPGSVTANYKLGGLRVIEGHAADAILPLQHAIALDPTFEKATYYLGRAYVALSRDAEGIACLLHATRAPDDETLNTLAWYQLVRVYRRQGRIADSDAALSHFRELRAQVAQRQQAKSTAQANRRQDLPRPEEIPPDTSQQ